MPRHVLVKELDLRTPPGQTHTFDTVNNTLNAVPGFKTSAAFFTFLRANLVLPPSTLNSTSSTPLLDPSSSGTRPPLAPSSLATMTSIDTPTDPLSDIPPLTTKPLTTTPDKTAALKLIADSIAQQRQSASRALIFHPLTIALYVALAALTSQWIYKSSADTGILLTTMAGVTMSCLIAVRGLTSGYLTAAEELTWGWLVSEEGEEDVIIGSRYGEEIIGACVVRLERENGSGRKKKGKGVVRAWTVRMRYRGGGVGTELLEEAVRVVRGAFGREAEVGFAAEHANSRMVLPEMFNGGFRRRERRAAGALEGVVESLDGKKKR